jgi:hypothetical protein
MRGFDGRRFTFASYTVGRLGFCRLLDYIHRRSLLPFFGGGS